MTTKAEWYKRQEFIENRTQYIREQGRFGAVRHHLPPPLMPSAWERLNSDAFV